jgi:hypothetical protein
VWVWARGRTPGVAERDPRWPPCYRPSPPAARPSRARRPCANYLDGVFSGLLFPPLLYAFIEDGFVFSPGISPQDESKSYVRDGTYGNSLLDDAGHDSRPPALWAMETWQWNTFYFVAMLLRPLCFKELVFIQDGICIWVPLFGAFWTILSWLPWQPAVSSRHVLTLTAPPVSGAEQVRPLCALPPRLSWWWRAGLHLHLFTAGLTLWYARFLPAGTYVG